MKLFKLTFIAIGILVAGAADISRAGTRRYDVSYYWYSVVSMTHQTGSFKIKARLSTLAGGIYTITPSAYGIYRYGFTKTITNNPGVQRVYSLYYK